MRTEKKHKLAQLRRWRIRKKVSGTEERPRMSVCFTNKNIHVQFIDDAAGVTLAAASTRSKATPDRDKLAANVDERQNDGHAGGRSRPGQGHQAGRVRPRRRAVPRQGQSRWPTRRAKPGLKF